MHETNSNFSLFFQLFATTIKTKLKTVTARKCSKHRRKQSHTVRNGKQWEKRAKSECLAGWFRNLVFGSYWNFGIRCTTPTLVARQTVYCLHFWLWNIGSWWKNVRRRSVERALDMINYACKNLLMHITSSRLRIFWNKKCHMVQK